MYVTQVLVKIIIINKHKFIVLWIDLNILYLLFTSHSSRYNFIHLTSPALICQSFCDMFLITCPEVYRYIGVAAVSVETLPEIFCLHFQKLHCDITDNRFSIFLA